MSKTSIEWTDESTNPIRARRIITSFADPTAGKPHPHGHYCEKISAGCRGCYASRFQPRFGMPEFPKQTLGENVELYFDESHIAEVLKRREGRRWFWCDMTDLFGDWVPFEWVDRCFAAMAATPRHTHQVLTKRPARMRKYLQTVGEFCQSEEARDRGHALGRWFGVRWPAAAHAIASDWWERRRMPNVWFGTSIENRNELHRLDELRACTATIRFLSCEPLLEDLGPLDLTGIHQVIAGGESGHDARPPHPDWVRNIRDQCQQQRVAFLFKQWGAWGPFPQVGVERQRRRIDFSGRDVTDLPGLHSESDAVMYRLGKKKAGRLLDGREWMQFPAAASAAAS